MTKSIFDLPIRLFHGTVNGVDITCHYHGEGVVSLTAGGTETVRGKIPGVIDQVPPAPAFLMELDDYDWKRIFELGDAPIRTNPMDKTTPTDSFTREDVKEIIGIVDGEENGDDWVGVFLLKDGRYAAIWANVCMTGWDCEGSASSVVACTLKDLVRYGLTDEQRRRLSTEEPEFLNRIAARLGE